MRSFQPPDFDAAWSAGCCSTTAVSKEEARHTGTGDSLRQQVPSAKLSHLSYLQGMLMSVMLVFLELSMWSSDQVVLTLTHALCASPPFRC